MKYHYVLIIEDEPDLRETIKDLLEMEGFQVLTAANGREGLQMLAETERSCLILLDLMMPVMNGWQFLEALKTEYEHLLATLPVVVVSAAADLTDVERQYGFPVMKKPMDVGSLISLAREYCAAC